MKSNKFDPCFHLLLVSLSQYIDALKPEILDLKSVQEEKLYQRWITILRCFVSCKKIVEAIEVNDRDGVMMNIFKCKVACTKCISVCSDNERFRKALHIVGSVRTLLREYSRG